MYVLSPFFQIEIKEKSQTDYKHFLAFVKQKRKYMSSWLAKLE